LPAPELLIRIGTGIIGADSELVLRGMDVVPHALAKSGFTFQFPSLQSALADLLN
jgi:NAD dependent epimerase/dehydratase family enzyme